MTFHANGKIDISARVSNALSLSRGDVIDIMDDGDGEAYIYVKHRAPVVGRHEAVCFPTKDGGHHFRTWSLKLCRYVMDTCRMDVIRMGVPTGEPVTLDVGVALPIIYKYILSHDTRNQI